MDTFFEVLIHIGNVLSVIYNIPQIYKTWKVKKATDISSYFLWMRLASSIIWCIYCVYYYLWIVSISWFMSLISTIFILYYKYYPKIEFIELK